MSYSFSVSAASKAEAKEKVVVEMARVVTNQPMHAKDAHQAVVAANAFIDALDDAQGRTVNCSVNGYLSWTGDSQDAIITGANLTIAASLT